MKRKHLCLAGYALAALATAGCARKQALDIYATNPLESSPAVQQMVQDAYKAELAGNTDQALTLYKDVLDNHPSNEFARNRVDKLGGDVSLLAQRRLERVTKRPVEDTPESTPARPEPTIQVARAEKPQPTPPATQTVASTTPSTRTNSQENPFRDWFDESKRKPAAEEVKQAPAVAAAPVPEWARETASKPAPAAATLEIGKLSQSSTPSTDTEFEWARSETNAAPTVAQTRTPATPSIDDESVFDALDRRENPFAEIDWSTSKQEAVAATRSLPWTSNNEQPNSTSTPESNESAITRVAFAPGPESAVAHPLVSLCRDANVQVLGLVQQLESPLAETRREGLNNLGLLGKKANTARLPVQILCDDPVPTVAAEAAWTLWQIDGDKFHAVKELTKLVDSKDQEASEIAIQSLGLIGNEAIEAVPVLRSRLESANGIRRVRIAESLLRIEPNDGIALQSLIESTRYGRPGERVEATYALAHTPAQHLEALAPVLVNALHDKDEAVRTAAALTLGSFGEQAEQARLALEAAARFDTRPVRDAARATLACLPR